MSETDNYKRSQELGFWAGKLAKLRLESLDTNPKNSTSKPISLTIADQIIDAAELLQSVPKEEMGKIALGFLSGIRLAEKPEPKRPRSKTRRRSNQLPK